MKKNKELSKKKMGLGEKGKFQTMTKLHVELEN